jgi:PucR C-terminal helix-turn-helix domain
MPAPSRPYAAIPAEASKVLRPVLPSLADEIIAAIARDVPDYARAMEGEFGQVVRVAIEKALGRFVDLIEDPSRDDGRGRATYVGLGRGEMRAGRSLDALLSAYRLGSRLAWRRFVEAGVAGGLEPGAIYALGEGIFAYIDEISAESAEGYAEEQSAAAGERQRLRRRLVRLLAQDPPPSEETIRAAAAAASWPLPRTVAALVTAPEGEAATSEGAASGGTALGAASGAAAAGAAFGSASSPVPASGAASPDDAAEADALAARLARRLGEEAIGAGIERLAVVLVPDAGAPVRARRVQSAAKGRPAALGPAVPLALAGQSVRRATATHALLAAGRLGDRDFVRAEEHLPALVIAADPALGAELAAERLAPLRALPDGPRARLTETLRAWLDRPGQVQAVAAELGVHPQTVRYRVKQLRDLFGDRLEDPEARFELGLALRAG